MAAYPGMAWFQLTHQQIREGNSNLKLGQVGVPFHRVLRIRASMSADSGRTTRWG